MFGRDADEVILKLYGGLRALDPSVECRMAINYSCLVFR